VASRDAKNCKYAKYVVAYDDAKLLYVDAKDGEAVKVYAP